MSRKRDPRETVRTSGSSEESGDPEDTIPVVVELEKGVDASGLTPDISSEVRRELEEEVDLPGRKVSFEETPTLFRPDARVRVDEYDILQDIKEQKANVTIGQLLHDNLNYQRQLKTALVKPRRRAVRLPAVAVNLAEVEDFGAPEISVEIEGCIIPKVPVDGGSGVNLMLETTATDLGYTVFESTNQTLRMADQSRVIPVGKLSGIPTKISGTSYELNYLVIRVSGGKPFPLLLGRPWLYLAGVKVNWAKKSFQFGDPAKNLTWRPEQYKGETDELAGYTSGWTSSENSDSVQSYQVQAFREVGESDCGFRKPTPEADYPDQDKDGPVSIRMDDRSLGESSVEFTGDWIRKGRTDPSSSIRILKGCHRMGGVQHQAGRSRA